MVDNNADGKLFQLVTTKQTNKKPRHNPKEHQTFFSNDETEPSTENYRTILREKDPAEGHHGSRLMTGFLSQPTALTSTFVSQDIPLATPDRKVRSRTFPRLPKLFPYVDYQSLREG